MIEQAAKLKKSKAASSPLESLSQARDLGSMVADTTGSAWGFLTGLTPTGKTLNKLRKEVAMANPQVQQITGMQSHLSSLGISMDKARDLASIAQSTGKALDSAASMANKNTIFGRLNSTSAGQIAAPIVAMSLVGGLGLAAKKVYDVLNASGVNVDPSARLASAYGLERVFQVKPSLREKDPQLIRRYYETIFNTNPSITKDPVATGNLLERMVNFGGSDHALIKDLAETERALSEPQKRQLDLFTIGSSMGRR